MNDNEIDPVSEKEPAAEAKEAGAESLSADSTAVTVRRRLTPGRTGRLALELAAAVLLCAAIASSVVFYLQNKGNRAIIDANADARTAACSYAPVLADYDAKKLDPYFAAVLAGATGDWKKQFDSTSKELRDVLTQGEVVSKVNDVQCAIKSGDANSAEAIVVIGQTITSLGTQGKPAPGQLSMVMRLTKVDGRWLVNMVNSPLAPAPKQ
ncbi:Mce-associated membrane protein [Nocardia tenerifensis]|uniref:Mce-associated membrane protein n=1 Tax=Nocardia tenerifensis TaxID=228006 RepID=A0A318KJ15_9NOCA|nr:hypothetical protein [Nocardia tenerifensis]PXX68407.1 Mce-associated membrane protein [Nocardia tenerifensis]